MNSFKLIRRQIANIIYPEGKRLLKARNYQISAFKHSTKAIFINPEIHLRGVNKLDNLYLVTNNLCLNECLTVKDLTITPLVGDEN